MKRLQWIAPAVLMLAFAATNASAKVSDTNNYVYDTNDHPTLSLKNVNGSLVVEGWDQDRIEVTTRRTASNEEMLHKMRVRSDMSNNHLRIEVKYDFNDDYFNDDEHGNNASVDFTIKVPRGTEIRDVALVNGGIEISGVDANADVASVNGTVSVRDMGGRVSLTTVNGDVELDASGDVESIKMHSVNGGVRLMLPKKIDARIEAGTVHGDITTDGADVDVTRFSGTSMRGMIGKGTLRIDLSTVNGSIAIRQDGTKQKKAD